MLKQTEIRKLKPYNRIMMFEEWYSDIRPTPSFKHNLVLYYEWEYKYNKIKSASTMMPQRKSNMMNLVVDKMEPVFKSIVNSLILVYDMWLQQHQVFMDMTDEKGWLSCSYDRLIKKNKIDEFRSCVINDFKLYSKKFGHYDKEAMSIVDDLPVDKDTILNFARDYVYPLWLQDWNSSEMSKTIDRMKDMYSKLVKWKNFSDFSDTIILINFAINLSHQTGSMKDHISYCTDITIKELDAFSNYGKSQIDKWNKELKEMGVW